MCFHNEPHSRDHVASHCITPYDQISSCPLSLSYPLNHCVLIDRAFVNEFTMLLIHDIPATALRSCGHHVTESKPKTTQPSNLDAEAVQAPPMALHKYLTRHPSLDTLLQPLQALVVKRPSCTKPCTMTRLSIILHRATRQLRTIRTVSI
jgi:hypothetical protein